MAAQEGKDLDEQQVGVVSMPCGIRIKGLQAEADIFA